MSCEICPCVRTQYLVNADIPINFGDGLLYSETVLVKGIDKIEVTGNAGVQHRSPQHPVIGGDSYLDSRNRRLEILGALSRDRVKST